ncbi:MAG: membrane protein insertion efficiency factor YidD [Ignavibacterium sp.]|nr:membrane protein insertion efficiency factor YidD [Ignavibacterium sp.]MCX7611646.1 membrane protein insertion efficiency factor YidD [Ignavibacterium sp.]MDW8374475.1 membrane protein insertion efficiency factor YidD [Ignavibacteriales bacterium]
MIVIFLIFILNSQLISQVDFIRWEKSDNYLLIESKNSLSESIETKNINKKQSFIDVLLKVYKYSFSNFDGDNCSFYPSCSEFLAESFKLTNPIVSILLFFDRLSRDTNIFYKGDYVIINNRYYDPPSDYIKK